MDRPGRRAREAGDGDAASLAFARMPHRGRMLLLAELLEADERRVVCRAKPHDAPDHPLRVRGRLMAAGLVELGAQAAAAHASLHGVGSAHAGMLLALRQVRLLVEEVEDPAPLLARAERLQQDDAAALYRFEVTQNGAPLVEGEALLAMRAAPNDAAAQDDPA